MSEAATPPRDESTGQFTPSTEGLYGKELENAKAGFTTRKDDPPPAEGDGKTYGDDIGDLKEAAADLAARRRQPDEIKIDELRDAVGRSNPREAVTPEQAAKELSVFRGEASKFIDGVNLATYAVEVDKARAEEMKKNPRAAAELGLSSEDIEAAKSVDESVRPDTAAKPNEPGTQSIEGLDPEVEKALKHPQVRQAIEEELGRAETAKQDYSNALQTANQFAMASLVDHFPELANIPAQNWEAALQIFAQQAPDRFNAAMGTLQRVGQIQAAQAQWQQHEAQVAQQQFVASTEYEDANLVKRLGEDAANAANAATVSFLTDHGIPRHEAFQFIQKHPLMATAEAREVIWKAAQYDQIKRAAKAVPTNLPPVQRPGVSTGRTPATDNSAKIGRLQEQLAGATGDKAARLAGQIRTLKRAS